LSQSLTQSHSLIGICTPTRERMLFGKGHTPFKTSLRKPVMV
jgi:hypothetical protein